MKIKVVVTEPNTQVQATVASVAIGSVFKWANKWFLKTHQTDSSNHTVVWSLTDNYLTHFASCDRTCVTEATSVEVRVTP